MFLLYALLFLVNVPKLSTLSVGMESDIGKYVDELKANLTKEMSFSPSSTNVTADRLVVRIFLTLLLHCLKF